MKIKQILLAIALAILMFFAYQAHGASILFPPFGGTGIGTAVGADVGKCLKVLDDSPFTYQLGTCGGGGGSSPLTTKGDIYTYDTADARLPVGTNGFILASDSGEATGLKWIANAVGTVTSVSGTSNRITSSGGATPAIDIAATYVGQSSLTTLGTITTGVWNGTAIANANLANSTISGIALGSNLNALTATDSTLTFSGSYNGSTARTVGLNLGNANTWTAKQTFNTAAPRLGTITGSTQCLHVDTNGDITGTGSDCGSGSGGATTALDNLASVAINTSLLSDSDNVDALGDATHNWADLFLGSGSLINWNNGDITLTHSSNDLALAGGSLTVANAVTATDFLLSSGGSATDPSIRTTGDPELGIYFTGTTLVGFAGGGASYGTFNNSGFQLGATGARVTKFETDGTLAGNSDTLVPTQKAVKTYADTKQTLDSTLTALAAYNTNGILTQTAADTFTGRTITGTSAQISVANGDGVAGNPTLSFPADVLIPTVLTVPNTGLHLLDTNASHDLIVKPGSNITADRTLTFTTGDTDIIADLTAVTDEYVLAYDTGTNTWRGVVASGSGANTALSNLASVAINTSLLPGADGTIDLGSDTKEWRDLYLKSGGQILYGGGGTLKIADFGETGAGSVIFQFGSMYPTVSGFYDLGTTANNWGNIYLAEGGIINWDNSDATLTQTGNVLALAGADLRVATAGVGTNADSVPTLSSASTFTNKSLTSPLITNLSAGRMTFAGTSGLLTDDADLTYSSSTNSLSTGQAFLNVAGLDTTSIAFNGSSNTQGKLVVNAGLGTLSGTVSAASAFLVPTMTEATSGVHPLLAGLAIKTPSITNGTATTTATAGLYVEGASAQGVSNYAIWSDAGDNRFDGHMIVEGVTSTGATGTGKFVFDGSPTLVTPVLGAATYTTLSGGAVTDSALTATRATFAGTAGLLSDDAGFTFTAASDQLLLGEAGQSGSLKIYSEDGGTDHSTIFQPGTQTQDVVYTLPVDDGTSDQLLKTDGNGVLSWTTGSGGVAWDAIGDPSGNGTVAFGTTNQDITGAIDTVSQYMLRLTNTDADAANLNYILDLEHNDTSDAQAGYLKAVLDQDGTPSTFFDITSAATTWTGVSSMALTDGGLFDLSGINASATTEGLKLPQAASTTSSTAEGQLAWDTSDYLTVGDSSAARRILPDTQVFDPDNAGKCSQNLTSDAPAAFSVSGCSYMSLTSNDATSTNRTFCLVAGVEGQTITLMSDVTGTNEIEWGDGAAGACAGSTGAATFLNGVWPANANQNNDVGTFVYRTTATGAVATGWFEISRAGN